MAKRRAEAYWVEKTKRWQINVQINGQRKTFNSPTNGRQGKHECEQKADKWLALHDLQQRFTVARDTYLEWKKLRVTDSTYSNVNSDMHVHISPIIGNKWLDRITQHDWQTCLDNMAREGLSVGAMRRVVSTINNFCDYCQSRMWEIRPPKLLDVSAGKPAKEKRALNEDELNKLMKATDADGHYIYMFQFMLLTGMRCIECIRLKKSDVNPSAHYARIRKANNSAGRKTVDKKNDVLRTVGLPTLSIDILDAQSKMIASLGIESEYVFCTPTGECANSIIVSKMWKEFANKNEISCTLSELHYTYISLV